MTQAVEERVTVVYEVWEYCDLAEWRQIPNGGKFRRSRPAAFPDFLELDSSHSRHNRNQQKVRKAASPVSTVYIWCAFCHLVASLPELHVLPATITLFNTFASPLSQT